MDTLYGKKSYFSKESDTLRSYRVFDYDVGIISSWTVDTQYF